MKNRDKTFLLRMNDKEMSTLKKKVALSGLSREEYCRKVLGESTVKEAPDADTKLLIREIRQAGYSLNGILKKANAIGFIEPIELNKALEEVRSAVHLVIDTYSKGGR